MLDLVLTLRLFPVECWVTAPLLTPDVAGPFAQYVPTSTMCLVINLASGRD